ncbi:MAG: hypothetical protein CSA35_01610 [Dethiosulfovibrio peptidovorans]|nr:MAG: hypothetical protein CSA35_01610 [Dethiosulfovibrio peptidovorans]
MKRLTAFFRVFFVISGLVSFGIGVSYASEFKPTGHPVSIGQKSAGGKNAVVVRGDFDSIESVLEKMNRAHSIIDGRELENYDLSEVSQLYINCGSDTPHSGVLNKVKKFVEEGGSLYISDWAHNYLEPWGFTFEDSGEEGFTTGYIKENGLKKYLKGKDKISIHYDLSSWSVIKSSGGHKCKPLITGDVMTFGGPIQDAKLAILFKAGNGTILYTTFHTEEGMTKDAKDVLEFFADTTAINSIVNEEFVENNIPPSHLVASNSSSLSSAKNLGIPVKIVPSGVAKFFLRIYDFSESAKNAFSESALMNSYSCTVDMYTPNGTLYRTLELQNGKGAVEVPANDNTPGEWSFKVQNFSGYSEKSNIMVISTGVNAEEDPGLVIIGPAKPSTPERSPGVPPSADSSGSGCNAGFSLFILPFLALPLFLGRK